METEEQKKLQQQKEEMLTLLQQLDTAEWQNSLAAWLSIADSQTLATFAYLFPDRVPELITKADDRVAEILELADENPLTTQLLMSAIVVLLSFQPENPVADLFRVQGTTFSIYQLIVDLRKDLNI